MQSYMNQDGAARVGRTRYKTEHIADTAAMARAALSPEVSAQHRVRTLEPPQGGCAPGGQHFATHQRFTRFI
jgi:hypothetical protein